MTQRSRSRNAGLIDSAIGETVPYPIAPAWVSGRFYSGSIHSQALGTLSLGTPAYLVPIIVPHPVTVTSIGIEVTSAGGAGSLARLAIYTDKYSRPDDLVIDAGTVAVDGVAYQSASISQVIKAGPYWLGLANKTVTSAATVRAYQTGGINSMCIANVMVLTALSNIYFAITNNPATGGIVDTGWMQKMILPDINMANGNSANSPRIMLGV